MQSTRPFDVLLFDFGGVLIEYASAPRLLEWLDHSITTDVLWRKWLMTPAVRGFESGAMEAEAFADSLVAEFGLPVSPEGFLREFAVWPRALMPGAGELLGALRGRFTLASFSNTNTLHWERIRTEFDLLDYFDAHFPSHVVGKLKPDREAFEYIVDAVGCPAGRILFFDDNPMNIDGAREVGIEARRVDGPREVELALQEFEIDIDKNANFDNPSTSTSTSTSASASTNKVMA